MHSKNTKKNKITEDMPIYEILNKNKKHAAKITEVMLKHGLHCIGCVAGQFETLKEGCLAHGMSEKEIQSLLKELNKIVSKK